MYDPYGKPTFDKPDWSLQDPIAGQPAGAASAYANEILFCGYRYDPITGFYLIRWRVYHPTLGRWVQRDPTGYSDGPNLVQYVRSKPGASRDPLGLEDAGYTNLAEYLRQAGTPEEDIAIRLRQSGANQAQGTYETELLAEAPVTDWQVVKIYYRLVNVVCTVPDSYPDVRVRANSAATAALVLCKSNVGCPCRCFYRVRKVNRREVLRIYRWRFLGGPWEEIPSRHTEYQDLECLRPSEICQTTRDGLVAKKPNGELYCDCENLHMKEITREDGEHGWRWRQAHEEGVWRNYDPDVYERAMDRKMDSHFPR